MKKKNKVKFNNKIIFKFEFRKLDVCNLLSIIHQHFLLNFHILTSLITQNQLFFSIQQPQHKDKFRDKDIEKFIKKNYIRTNFKRYLKGMIKFLQINNLLAKILKL